MYKTVTITYTYGNGLISDNKKEAKGSDTEKRYYHYNHIGSTTAITDADGDLLYRIVYGTYGELTGIYDTDGELVEDKTAVIRAENLRFLYNGRYGVETGANGLYYMRARYYNPQIKRFINRDIIDGSITDSQSLNKYSYVQGNPVNLIDPFGLCAQDYFSRAGHELLDWLGFIFDPADAINFLWYTAEGNAAMAAATAVAIVPAAGSFIAKGTKQAIKAGKKAAQKAGEKAAKNATEKAAKKAAAKKLAKEATETGVEKAAKEAAEKATEKTAKEAAEKTGQKTVLSQIDAEKIAFDATHGPADADRIVLGKYENGGPTAYTNIAKNMDAQYFQIDNWDELAKKYSDDELWKINEKFLDAQTSSGRKIYLSHDPKKYMGKGQFYSREIQYLLDKGYHFVKEGGFWRAVR